MGRGSIRPRQCQECKPVATGLLGQRHQGPGEPGELAGVGRLGRPWPPAARRSTVCAIGFGWVALGAVWAALAAGRSRLG